MRLPRVPKGCFQVGARDRQGSSSVASMDSTTYVSGEHGELSLFLVPQSLVPCIRTLYGFRAQRVGEASNPGPASRRRRTQRLRALQRDMNSDTESEDECRNVPRRLESETLAQPPTFASTAFEPTK